MVLNPSRGGSKSWVWWHHGKDGCIVCPRYSMRIGLISDTHLPSSIREPWPEIALTFHQVDLILHAGDIVSARILDWLERLAPVVAALGNEDFGLEDARVSRVQVMEVEGWTLGMVHALTYGLEFGQPLDILVSGHTHKELLTLRDGTVHVNPGSATLPHQYSTRLGTVGLLELTRTQLSARVVRLGDGPSVNGTLLANPGLDLQLEVSREQVGPGSRVAGDTDAQAAKGAG